MFQIIPGNKIETGFKRPGSAPRLRRLGRISGHAGPFWGILGRLQAPPDTTRHQADLLLANSNARFSKIEQSNPSRMNPAKLGEIDSPKGIMPDHRNLWIQYSVLGTTQASSSRVTNRLRPRPRPRKTQDATRPRPHQQNKKDGAPLVWAALCSLHPLNSRFWWLKSNNSLSPRW